MSQVYGKFFSDSPLSESHVKILELVGTGKKVLELGASAGYMTKRLKENGCSVDIVEIDADDAKKAGKFADKVLVGSLEDKNFLNKITENYEVIMAADVLEHLKNPEEVLEYLRKRLTKGGEFIISLPNIACWEIRKELFFRGKFEYTEMGILDRTHLRFYTHDTFQKLLRDNGYKVKSITSTYITYPFRKTLLRLGGFIGKMVDAYLVAYLKKNNPNFCTYHMVIEAVVKE